MTPERAKALEAVAEAARVWLNVAAELPYQNQQELDSMDACEKALTAYYALPAEPADAGEMVEVWGYVRTDPKGFVDGRVDTDEKYIRDRASAWGRTENGQCMGTVFSARIPRPVVPEVRAEVET